jgi:formylglycine-generating enzyme required for sulfatase activity
MLVAVEPTTVVYDKQSESSRVYGWDNEYGSKTADVAGFKASKYLCSNEEYLEFVSAGGYEQRQWWDDEGWTWVQYTGARHPKFWIAPASSDGGAGGGTPRKARVIYFVVFSHHLPCGCFLAVFLLFS